MERNTKTKMVNFTNFKKSLINESFDMYNFGFHDFTLFDQSTDYEKPFSLDDFKEIKSKFGKYTIHDYSTYLLIGANIHKDYCYVYNYGDYCYGIIKSKRTGEWDTYEIIDGFDELIERIEKITKTWLIN